MLGVAGAVYKDVAALLDEFKVDRLTKDQTLLDLHVHGVRSLARVVQARRKMERKTERTTPRTASTPARRGRNPKRRAKTQLHPVGQQRRRRPSAVT